MITSPAGSIWSNVHTCEDRDHRLRRQRQDYTRPATRYPLQSPITHLDTLYYDDEWNTLPKEKLVALQEESVAQNRWIIDGNFASTLPIRIQRATEVIFLDLPPLTCLSGIVQRRLKYGGGQDDETGVYDRIHWGFVKYVWNYRKTMGPRVRNLILEHGSQANVHIVYSRRGANRLVERIIRGQSTQD